MNRTKLRRGQYGAGVFPKAYWSMWDDAWAEFRDLFGEQRAVGITDPRVTIDVSDGEAIVEVNLAGYDKKDISVHVEGQLITISGTLAEAEFEKTFHVESAKFDMDSIAANYENGLLTVTLGKITQPDLKARRTIPIQ